MEMNTRLQVEHPVTEAITGLDLVELQLRVAAGEPLPIAQSTSSSPGTRSRRGSTPRIRRAASCPPAAGCRCCAEPAGPGVRVDSALLPGLRVSSDYDPMLAKVIAWAPDRDAAIALLRRSLAETAVLGVTTNLEFLRAAARLPQVASATMDTELIGRELAIAAFAQADDSVFATAALLLFAQRWAVGRVAVEPAERMAARRSRAAAVPAGVEGRGDEIRSCARSR